MEVHEDICTYSIAPPTAKSDPALNFLSCDDQDSDKPTRTAPLTLGEGKRTAPNEMSYSPIGGVVNNIGPPKLEGLGIQASHLSLTLLT